MKYVWESAIQLRRLVTSREVSITEVAKACIARFHEVESQINAFVEFPEREILAQARSLDSILRKDGTLGLLTGVPISIKDVIAVKGQRLTYGSLIFGDDVADFDAPSVARVRAAGALIVGKTTTSELGCKGVGTSPISGVTRNPWNLLRTPGGSSAGAAASIAAGVTPLGLGTDGGGSVRLPASFTGLFGLKPQFGRIPIYPASSTPSLSHVGPLARSVRDAALLMQVVSGFDDRDPHSIVEKVPDYLAECEVAPDNLRIAWSPTLGYGTPDREILDIVSKGVAKIEALGCNVVEVGRLFDDPYEIFASDFESGIAKRLAGYLGDNRQYLDPAVEKTVNRGLDRQLRMVIANQIKRDRLRLDVEAVFQQFDILITPSLPVEPFDATADFPRGRGSIDNILGWIQYCYPFNLTGEPAASLPVGFTKSGLPVGLQIISRRCSEHLIFRLASAYEQAHPWSAKIPDLREGELEHTGEQGWR